jgi:hypothetical protein
MLSHAVNQGFANPDKTYSLYDKVRSEAVHGEDLPDVTWIVVADFASAVRRTLNDYLTYAKERGVGHRSELLRELREHPDRPQLAAWLRAQGGDDWEEYLAQARAVDAASRGDTMS